MFARAPSAFGALGTLSQSSPIIWICESVFKENHCAQFPRFPIYNLLALLR